jgi:hypothetical protein
MYFGVVISQGAFADLIVCLTQFSKNHKFQKKSLQAIEMLKSTVPKMLRTPECPLSARSGKAKDAPTTDAPSQPTQQTEEEQFWFPVLFAFHDVLMTGDDLEVRSRYDSSSYAANNYKPVLTMLQRIELSFRHAYEVWQAIPSRLLGYPLASTALSDLHGPSLKIRDVQICYQ